MKRELIHVLLIMTITSGCREKFVPTFTSPITGFLVVEGFINSGTGATSISLSRTTKLSDTVNILRETKASVRVEAQNSSSSFLLSENSPGRYTHPQLTLNSNDQYRLRITTAAGRQYVSDYSAVRRTPDIDSIQWKEEKDGVQLYANSHDPAGKTIYYRYQYDETWEYHSPYGSYLRLIVVNGMNINVELRDKQRGTAIDSSIFKCWQNFNSINILETSTEKLSQDIVSAFPFAFIEPHSQKLSVLYSVNLKQYAMSREAFLFYDLLKKNTQQLGSIFDAQPSENNGNLHALDNSGEPVIGFIEVSEEKQKRIFINNAQVKRWSYVPDCELFATANIPESLDVYINENNLPTTEYPPAPGTLKTIYYSKKTCVDCTLTGTNVKPAYWPW